LYFAPSVAKKQSAKVEVHRHGEAPRKYCQSAGFGANCAAEVDGEFPFSVGHGTRYL
jgi:hypothetical protein